jgi:hypothetical protein
MPPLRGGPSNHLPHFFRLVRFPVDGLNQRPELSGAGVH